MQTISRIEEILMLMVCRLQDEAYGMQIREEVKKVSGKQYSIGGIYVPLDRLVKKGLLEMHDEVDEARMGRPRRKFSVTEEGFMVLRETKKLESAIWDLPELVLNQIISK